MYDKLEQLQPLVEAKEGGRQSRLDVTAAIDAL